MIRIISYEVTGNPKGIRDEGGYLLFFPALTFYTGQENRYKKELREQKKLAKSILKMLKAL